MASVFAIASLWAGLAIYGAATFVHVCGKDGVRILRAASPGKILFAMPVLPLVLILVRVRVAVRLHVHRPQNAGAPQVYQFF